MSLTADASPATGAPGRAVRGARSRAGAPSRPPSPPRARGGFVALAVLCLAELVGVMDNTIINVGIPTLGRAFSASTTQLQWIVDAYTLVFAVLMLPGGHLGDRIGRRRVLTL